MEEENLYIYIYIYREREREIMSLGFSKNQGVKPSSVSFPQYCKVLSEFSS